MARLKQPHRSSVSQNDASGGTKVSKQVYNTRSKKLQRMQMKRLPAVLVGGKFNSESMAGINLSNDGGPRETISGFKVQRCCLNLQSTIEVLKEALNDNTTQLKALESELKIVKRENERVIAELNQTKPEIPESKRRLNSIMKSFAGVFKT